MHRRSLLAALVATVAISSSGAEGVIRAPCRDGVPPVNAGCAPGTCARPVQCDTDRECNGVCTYDLHVCPRARTRRPPADCVDESVTVPVGLERVITIAGPRAIPTRFLLRCGSHPRGIACPTTSTTTSSTTTTTTAPPCSVCFLTVTDQCLGPCTANDGCGNQPNVLCLSVADVLRLTGITCTCPTTSTTTTPE
jgi:hypothetical protein